MEKESEEYSPRENEDDGEDEDDPPMKIKKIDINSLGTLGRMSNAWYEIEEKEEIESDEEEDEEVTGESKSSKKQITGGKEENSSHSVEIHQDYDVNEVDIEDDEEVGNSGNGDEEEEDVDEGEYFPEVTALQLMNTDIDKLIASTNHVDSLLLALLQYSQNLQKAIKKQLNSSSK